MSAGPLTLPWFSRSLWIGLALLWAGLPADAADDASDQAQYQRFAAIAGAPLDEVRFFRVHFWQPLGERALVLWLGREEPYLVDLREHCFGLKTQVFLRIGDYQRPGRNLLRARWSQVLIDAHRSCRIGQIRALDFSRIGEMNPRFLPKSEARVRNPAVKPELSPTETRNFVSLVSTKVVQPDYPTAAAARSRQGITQVAAQVDQQGTVIKTEVLSSSGHADLDREALRVVLRWQFEPYRSSDGQAAWVQVPVVFALRQ